MEPYTVIAWMLPAEFCSFTHQWCGFFVFFGSMKRMRLVIHLLPRNLGGKVNIENKEVVKEFQHRL